MLNVGVATGTRATRTSTKPRDSTRETLVCSHNTRVHTSACAVSLTPWQSLSRLLNITPDDIDTLVLKARIAQAEGDLPRAAALLGPLRLGADYANALETQVYQAILESRPAPVIAQLREILAKPDQALGYYNGELRFWLGWAQEVSGDHDGARKSWNQARTELESFLKEQPENVVLMGDLALTNMALGDNTAAMTLAERAIAMMSIEKDALTGPRPLDILARVAARIGDPDRSISTLEKLLSIPYEAPLAANPPLTPALLRLDPMFEPLRKNPRFQKLYRLFSGKMILRFSCDQPGSSCDF